MNSCDRAAILAIEPTTPANLFGNERTEFGGEGGIRTHVPLTRQDAFEAPPLRPLRYLSVPGSPASPAHAPGGAMRNTRLYTAESARTSLRRPARPRTRTCM